MKIVTDQISVDELSKMAGQMFGDLVKAVVDVEKGIMVVDGELHADEEALLLKNGSEQSNLWGINLYPELYGQGDWLEFDSMINLRSNQANFSREVEDSDLRKKIVKIVNRLVKQ